MTDFLDTLFELIIDRRNHPPPDSYTASLFAQGTPRIAQKVGEEAVEVVVAAASKNKAQVVTESADLLYHLLVLLADQEVSLKMVKDELKRRHQ